MAKPKIHATTQKFIEMEDIQNDVVFLKGRNACSILETSAVNFFLLSQDEQNARIYSYMSLLNSLSFAIQIIIVSKKVDLSNYLAMLDDKINNVNTPKIREHLTLYREFIQELIKGGQLLDKKIYVVVPFSPLELPPVTAATSSGNKKKMDYKERVTEALASKREAVAAQIQRIGLSAKPLQGEELAKLFYELFNQDTISLDYNTNDIKNVIL